jgi:hypothetical protein
MWILHCFRMLMITFREFFPKYLKICREYSLNMAEAADFSMPDAFAKDFLYDINERHDNFWDSVEYNTCESCIVVYVHSLVQTASVLAIEHQ